MPHVPEDRGHLHSTHGHARPFYALSSSVIHRSVEKKLSVILAVEDLLEVKVRDGARNHAPGLARLAAGPGSSSCALEAK